jgi:hypothetical protein
MQPAHASTNRFADLTRTNPELDDPQRCCSSQRHPSTPVQPNLQIVVEVDAHGHALGNPGFYYARTVENASHASLHLMHPMATELDVAAEG